MWINVEDKTPDPETPVLIIYKGEVRIGELVWERASFEDTYDDFLFWDCPYNDGQIWEYADVTHWQPIPALQI
ncbi:MAG: DUF551 domain-containing protein [Methylococcaceae bacterium]